MVKALQKVKTKGLIGVLSMMAIVFSFTTVALPSQASAADDYEYAGSFYWHESCEEAGKAGIPKGWSDYYCEGSGWPWDDYDLYVKYN